MDLWDWKARIYRLRECFPFRLILLQEQKNISALLDICGLPPGPVLDVGSGTGSSFYLLPGDRLPIALDRSYAMLKRADSRYMHRLVGDGSHLPIRRKCIAVFSAIGLLEYMRGPDALLAEAEGVLKSGGLLIFTLAPANGVNRLRRLLGHKLYYHRPETVKEIAQKRAFRFVGMRRSLMQVQYCFLKASSV